MKKIIWLGKILLIFRTFTSGKANWLIRFDFPKLNTLRTWFLYMYYTCYDFYSMDIIQNRHVQDFDPIDNLKT